MTVPERLEDWTLGAVAALCSVGMGEGERHDFKGGFQDPTGTTKTCCAFANTYGGYLIYGVTQSGPGFTIEGMDPNPEFMSQLRDKVKAEPEIEVRGPIIVEIPSSPKVLYIVHIPRSARRPHLPSPADKRFFWKRSGANCTQMTLEEIRSQMLAYEEKLEKLTLMAFDLRNKAKTIGKLSAAPAGSYFGDTFQFEIVDRVVVESYSLLRPAPDILIYWERLKQVLMAINAEKQKLLSQMALSYEPATKGTMADAFTAFVKREHDQCLFLTSKMQERLKELYGVEAPDVATVA